MNQGGGIPRTFDGIHAMTPDLRGLTSAKKLRRLRRWFKRNVLRQVWMLEGFGSAFTHEEMLLDQIRCDAYREAIRCTVKPGDVVVDLGAGTGLLSFFALQAGARHVYAIEMTRIADVAAELIEANGFRDRITLIRQTSTRARLPERCDVLVTETLSAFCFDTENIIEFVADARERFLKPGGRIVPESADTFLLPVSSESFGIGQLQSRLYDVDYRPFIKRSAAEYRSLRASGKPFLALGNPALCYHVDFRKDSKNPGKSFVPFRVIADGRLDGFLGWFEARLCEGVTLSNSPYLPLTSWWQLYLPVAEQPHYRAGQTMLLCMDPNIVDGEAEWKYAVQPATPTGSNAVWSP
jgi:protein arginine N-methyltransferase 1